MNEFICLPEKSDNSCHLSQTIYRFFDSKSIFNKKRRSILVDIQKIMRKLNKEEPFFVGIKTNGNFQPYIPMFE